MAPSCCNVAWGSSCSFLAQNHCPALCGGCGSGGAGDCCASNDTPYCSDAPCCESVCAVDPFCCDAEGGGVWDQPCADLAWQLCPDLPGCTTCVAGAGSCCSLAGNGSPGCGNSTCCETVCAIEPDCCDPNGGEWDADCAALAHEHCPQHCGCGGTAAGQCCSANSTPWCNNAECCQSVCAQDPYCCEVAWDECCVQLASEMCPHPDWPKVNICDDPPPSICGAGNGDCCSHNGSAGCDDADCCIAVCKEDPFCCDTLWDGICANAASSSCECDCGIICDPVCAFTNPTGNCFETGGTGCLDFDCCEAVCAVDHFCCSITWDEMCITTAYDVCCPGLPECNPADLTFDGIVSVPDLLILLENWGECDSFGEHCPDPEACPPDFNHDQTVGVPDLLFLLQNWG